MNRRASLWLPLLLALLMMARGTAAEDKGGPQMAKRAEEGLKKFVPVELGVDVAKIDPKDRAVLKRLIQAADILNEIFWLQVGPQAVEARDKLRQAKAPELAATKAYMEIMYGPWDRLEEDKPFHGEASKPKGAGYYPSDLTKEQFEAWLRDHPQDKEAFISPFTVIQRQGDKLLAVAYHEAYKDRVTKAAALLDEAAGLSADPTLKEYLTLRAQGLRTDKYFDSDVAWLKLSGSIDATIGPYEVYEDRLNGLKAAYEAFITLRDREESEKLEVFGKHIKALEESLPLAPELRGKAKVESSPIVVVNLVYSAGDTRAGVQTTAFNLPNDEEVRAKHGSKKVMLKNVSEAKFKNSLVPIAQRVIAPDQLPLVQFEAYFTDILLHEISHGLGPGFIPGPDGKEITVNQALKELYPAIEEGKADMVGLYCAGVLADKGVITKEMERQIYVSYLAGIFRAARFGMEEAHGKGVVINLNTLMDHGGVALEHGHYRVNFDKIREAVSKVTALYLELEAKGSYDGAKAIIATKGQASEAMRAAIAKLSDIPVDIRPQYPLDSKL